MNKITSAQELHDLIAELEGKRTAQELAIREQVKGIYENLQPANIVKYTFRDIFSADGKSNLLRSAVGIASAVASRRLFVGKSANLFKKMLGLGIEFGVAALIAKKTVKDKSVGLIRKIFPPKKNVDGGKNNFA